MKVVHVSAFERQGGAAIAAQRLHSASRGAGIDSRLLVQFGAGDSVAAVAPRGKWAKAFALLGDSLEPLPLAAYRQRTGDVFSSNWLPSGALRRVREMQPDLVHLHWLGAGALSVGQLRHLGVPIVWTLHDMWPITGGCHYAGSCAGYVDQCGHCPQLGSHRGGDLSRWTMRRKHRAWRALALTAVAPSQWLADSARRSSLFRDRDVRVIRNPLDLERWRPVDAQFARRVLGLPDGPVLLFAAARGLMAPYKGGECLLDVLRALHASGQRFTLALMGGGETVHAALTGFAVHHLGNFHDEVSRVLAYSAADLTVHVAEQDNLPNTIAESMACGTPVAAFRVGGVPEMIGDRSDGILVAPGGGAAMADALAWYLTDADRDAMSAAARERAEAEYAQDVVARAYADLYVELLRDAR